MAKLFCIRGHTLAETRKVNSSDGNARCYECTKIRQRKYSNSKGKDWQRNQNLKNKYKISLEEWNILFDSQNCCCAICGVKESTWHTDHNHITGKVRGILCASCNINLGGYEAIIKYKTLEEYLK